jgi:hypothetical protein
MTTPIRPTEKDKMQAGIEYACLYFNRGSDESFRIEFYDKQSYRKTNLMRGLSYTDLYQQIEAQGWQKTYGTGDGEGVVNYFQRPISRTNDPNWLPVILESSSAPTTTPPPKPTSVNKRHEYVQRPKWRKGRTGELEDGVEYMEIVFYRNFQGEGLPAEIITYAKGKQRASQKRYMDIHSHDNYIKDLEKDGWYEVHRTGDSEGILTYLERQLIVPLSQSNNATPPKTTSTDTHQHHTLMIGGEQRILQQESNSLFTEIIENGASKRQTGNIKYVLAESIGAGWTHLATHTSNTKTTFILGRNGHVMSSEHITPEHHAQLPKGVRITRIEDLGTELKVTAYDNQKVDNLRNQKKSLAEFVATLTQNDAWRLVYEAQELGHRVIYLGRIAP